MKVRNGFVSNSSSSSFLLVGIDVNDFESLTHMDRDELRELVEAGGLDIEESDDTFKVCLGKLIGYGQCEISLDELIETRAMVYKWLIERGVDVKVSDINVHSGKTEL